MARLRGIKISLAVKCQLLFGLAVLVIIAGALAVPWQRMEQLAKQPNIKAARFAADLLFRQAHSGTPDATTAPAKTESATAPASRPAWDAASLGDVDYPRPRILLAASPTAGLSRQPGRPVDSVATKALRLFRERGQENEYGEVGFIQQGTGESTRIYHYAAAIRLDASCLPCHGEYNAWMPGALATQPLSATTQARNSPIALPTVAAVPDVPGGTAATTRAAPGTGGAIIKSQDTTGNAVWPVVGIVRIDVPYQTDENQLLLNRIVIVVAGMLGGALAIVVFYLITTRLILQPVRVLKNTAEKVAKGDLNIRSAISTGDEFQQLSETFNTMLATLKGSQDQLEATNRSLDTRVGELAQSNVDLYEANRVKSEFLTNVTHELRTPLNAIIGFADLLAETAKDPKQQRYSENIRASAGQLLDLINDLLDLAKIEAGKIVLRDEKVNVADVCEAMANFMRPLAQKKNISLELSIDSEMPLITTDPGRFQQILYNFLSNAIKFTPNDGKVAIDARCEPVPIAHTLIASKPPVEPPIRISISDSGPGISTEDQKLIFEKFRQLDGSVTRQHSGSGLGLAISSELANMLGAKIEVVSASGKGATFSLIIPMAKPQSMPQAPTVLDA